MSEVVRRRRRSWSVSFKRRVVAEASLPGSSVAAVARRHDLNTNLVFNWRRRYGGAEDFLPVLIDESSELPSPEDSGQPGAASDEHEPEIDVTLLTGHRVKLRGRLDPDFVVRLLRGLC